MSVAADSLHFAPPAKPSLAMAMIGNCGFSALIDARGRVLNSLPWRSAGYFDASLPPPASRLTFFARFGNVIPLLIGFALLLAGIALARAGRYRRNT